MEIISWTEKNIPIVADYLIKGEVVVLPTDTLYGVLALARDSKAVESVYEIKGRKIDKPFIILIKEISDLELFGITPNQMQRELMDKNWPGPVSIILPCNRKGLEYLHRGSNSLAFRLPDNDLLRKLLKITGPLVAPSANTEGETPAGNVEEAIGYFGEKVSLYVDGEERRSQPSKIISLVGDKPEIIRG